MKILQQPVKLKRHARVHVNFSRPANVFLMTEVNFKKYKEGATHKRIGGWYEKSPAEFTAPYDGLWHAVIEKGSHYKPDPITGSVEILPPLRKEVELPGGSWTDDEETPAAEAAEQSVVEEQEDEETPKAVEDEFQSEDTAEDEGDSSEEEEDEDK